ncbi:MAG: FAD:protein FMN transferase [Oscillospiraceae bacterium]|nr:FAD:protein FMN transferase [Oscillospiraceae bacterium]
MKKRIFSLLLAALLLTGCGAQVQENIAPQSSAPAQESASASRDVFAMDTYMTITCYGENCEAAADAAVEEIERLDALLSVGNPNSEISRVNETGSGTLSEDTAVMLRKSLELYEGTGGRFDITVYPLMVLWGFTSGDFAVPEEQQLQAVLAEVGSDRMRFDAASSELTLAPGQGIDLGGIAKGFTSDRLMELFAEYGLTSAIISLGGNVQLFGAKPDGSDWRCGIQDPFGDGLMGVLTARDCAVITSGAYERYFTGEDGQIYHHILDPKTGYPANRGLVSVTIVSESGMLADGLSTSCYVMGLEDAAQYWRTSSEEFDMILMTEGGDVYVTAPLAEQFSTDYPLYVIDEEDME